jgi:cytokinesis protein
VVEVLTVVAFWEQGRDHGLVISALEALSVANNETNGPFAYWFKSFEQALVGRGRMGTLVGARDDIRKGSGGVDTSLNDYTVMRMIDMISHITVFNLSFFST